MPNNIEINLKPAEESDGQAKINFKETKPAGAKKLLKNLLYICVFLTVSFSLFYINANISEQNSSSSSWFDKIPILGRIKHLVESADRRLKGEEAGRINILLLGMGGKNHEGGYLTDTIILASLQPSTKKAALLSIPRDMAIPIEDMGWRKINNVNAYAETQTAGSGGLAVSQTVSDVLNMPIDYYLRIDFAGFINIIDRLGGVKIYVDNTLEDYKYPVMGMGDAENYESRYEHLVIEKGWQEMDGELALKYARSRHALGAEGSDFARSKRQQKILEAVKEKVLSINILFEPTLIIDITNELQEHISTNLKTWEIIKIWSMFKNIEADNIINKALDNSPNGLLTDTINESGAYILIPRNGDFSEIQYLAGNIFSDAPAEAKTRVTYEKAAIDVRNGTWINGLANKAALDLEKYGFDVIHIGNCGQQNFQTSVIYDLTGGAKAQSLTILKEKTKANVSFELPQWLVDDLAKELSGQKDPLQPDFILVLGQNADSTASGAENTAE